MPRTYFPHALVEAFTPLNYRLPKPSKPISTPVSNPSLEAARESKIPLRDSRRCNRQSERKSKLLKAADSARAVDKRLRRVAGQMAQMNLAS